MPSRFQFDGEDVLAQGSAASYDMEDDNQVGRVRVYTMLCCSATEGERPTLVSRPKRRA